MRFIARLMEENVVLREFYPKSRCAYLGRRYFILYQLRDQMYVTSPAGQAVRGLVHPGTGALDNEGAVPPEDVVKLEGGGVSDCGQSAAARPSGTLDPMHRTGRGGDAGNGWNK